VGLSDAANLAPAANVYDGSGYSSRTCNDSRFKINGHRFITTHILSIFEIISTSYIQLFIKGHCVMGILGAILNLRFVFCGLINFRMVLTALALSLMISGCASVRGYPDRLIKPVDALKEIEPIVERKNIEACNVVKTIDCRNHILSAGMIGVDINFSEFERKLFKENREISFLTTVTTLGLTTAGAMTGTAALSGIATGVVGSKEAFDKEILLDQAKNAIHTQMRALRQTVANRIRYGMKQSFDDYPLDSALIDIEEYYNAGTLLGAFVGITASAGQQIEESEVNKDLISQNKDPVTFSPLLTGGKPLGGMPDIAKGPITREPPPPLSEQSGNCQGNECNLRQNDVRQIQQALCLKELSGDFDEQTRSAITLFRASNIQENKRRKGKLSDKEISFLSSIHGCLEGGFENAYERFFFGQDVNGSAKENLLGFSIQLRSQGVLNVPANPQNLDDLRPSIKQFQKNKDLQPTGIVTPDLLSQFSDG
jgi:hypothetical protein